MRKNRSIRRGAFLTVCLLLSVHLVAWSQSLRVAGSVTDKNGDPLPGVSIVVKGTTTGTITMGDGSYQIEVPSSSSTLVYSFIGFQSQEVMVGGQSNISVTLQDESIGLSDVVVVGYGTQRKESVTGSVASLKGEVVRDVPSANISRALQGRVAGVEMSQTSSKPGSEMQIRIRGTRSLNASNDPLIVLDGIPFAGSIGDINPGDIKSIDILKDASATAIYGSRGANGVILVSTNKGTKGQEAKFSYNGYYGLKDIFAKYPMMNGSEFVALRATGTYQNTLDESNDVNTDWQDLLYKTGMVTSHDIGVNGGTEKGSYSFGAGYYRDEAVVPLQDYSRYSMRASLDQEIGQYFKVGFTSTNNYSVNNGNNLGAVYTALARSPIANPYNADGSLKEIIQEQSSGAQWVSTRERLESLDDKYIDQTRSFGSYNTMYGEVKIPGVEGLKYRVNVGLNYRQSNSGSYTGEGVFSGNPKNLSTASVANSHRTNWAVENLLTYDRLFADKHQVNAVAMYSAEETQYNRSSISVKDIPSDAFQFYNLGRANGDITLDPSRQEYEVSGLLSWMGRVMYSFDSRYMVSVTLRSDGSSRLADGEKWHTYPAVSAGWNIKNEAFMQNVTWLDNLKLRVGYGQTSNQSVSPYKTLGLLNTRPYNFGDEYATGFYVSELPNSKLGWEYSETMNYGVDFGVLNGRMSGTLEYYVQNTKDVLLSVGLPATSGVSSFMGNIGETQNKGFELSLNGVILDDYNGWTWEAGVNLYANRNKLLSLASGQERDENNWWFVGSPIDVIYDYEKIGLWQEGDSHLAYLEKDGNPGMIRVKYTGTYDDQGNPTRKIGPEDRQILNPEADFQGGFNTRVAYKGFDLSIIAAFKSGGILNSTLYGASGYLNTMNARSGNNVKVDYWTPNNTGAKYPKPNGLQSGDNPKYGSTLGYFDASYLKIRTITLGYDLQQNWLKTAGIDKLRFYATVENPFVFFSPYTDESGMDPETNSYGDENVAVAGKRKSLIVGTNTPTTRNYLFGINLTF